MNWDDEDLRAWFEAMFGHKGMEDLRRAVREDLERLNKGLRIAKISESPTVREQWEAMRQHCEETGDHHPRASLN